MSASLLRPFGPEIWLAEGPETEVIGFRYPTRMAVIRLAGGGLLIWSPVALSEPLRGELQDLGEVRFSIAAPVKGVGSTALSPPFYVDQPG